MHSDSVTQVQNVKQAIRLVRLSLDTRRGNPSGFCHGGCGEGLKSGHFRLSGHVWSGMSKDEISLVFLDPSVELNQIFEGVFLLQ